MRQWNRLILTGMLALSLVSRNAPQPVAAATQVAMPPAKAPAAVAANPGIQYKLVYNNVAGVFEMYMKPDTTLVTNYTIGYAQVTIKAPAGFAISAGPTATAGVNWSVTSINRTASTGLSDDYFGIESVSPPNNTPLWTAGNEVKMFTFSASTCLGALSIITNGIDPIFFISPTLGAENSIVIDYSYGELYDGNYAGPNGFSANCYLPDLTTTIGQPSPSLAAGQPSNVPVTVTNSGPGAATGPITTTMTLPTGVSAPATFNNNGWTCSTAGQTVTCNTPGPISPTVSSGFVVPATPNASVIGQQPVFNATTSPVPGESNTANNNAAPMTPSNAVVSGNPPTITTPASGSTTNDTTPTITGSADPTSTVTIYNAGVPICTTTASATGTFSCTPASALPTGATTISATASTGSYTSPAATRFFNIDTSAPAAPTVVTPTETLQTSDNTPTFSGTAEPGSTVTVTVGGVPICSGQADGAGNWTCTPTTALSDGPKTALVTATDPSGNTSPATTRNFTVDTAPPAAPSITSPTGTVGSTTPALSGSGEPGATVTVKEGGTTVCTAVVNGVGNWTCTPTTPLTNGAHTLTPTQTDPAGNTSSPGTPLVLTVDTVAPAAPVVVTPTEAFKTNDNTPTITGTAEPSSTVMLKEGGVTICTTVTNASGTWSCTTPTLADGLHTVLATATDPSGNTGPAATRNFSVDSAAPAPPAITTPVTQTNDSTPAIGGTAEPGSTVTVSEGGTPLCTAIADGSGNWSCSPTTALGDGLHSVTATATDPAGNTSLPSTPKTFTVDTTAPAAPNVTSPAEGSTTANQTPNLAGTAEPNSTVVVKDGATTICTTQANASGVWSCTSTPLTNGPHTLSTTATDAAGNTGPADTQNFTVNNAIASVINNPTAGQVVSTTTPVINGTGTPSGTVVVTEGGATLCTTTANAAGNWSCTPGSALGSGPHSIIATVTDSGGGSVPSTVRTFTVDNTAPTAPTVISPTAGSTTGDNTPTISGTAEPSSTVQVSDGGVPICTAVADASGNWTCTATTPMTDGAHALAVTATDPAGNTSPPTTRPFTVDTVPPAAPTVSSPTAGSPISNTTPPVSGNAEPGSTVTVRDGPGGPVLCTAVANASGTWSCTPTTALTDGPHTLSTTATDPTGNTSPATNVPVTIDSTAPIAPAVIAPTAGSIVSDTTPTISGTGEPSTTVKVTDGVGGPVLCSAVVQADGSWSCTSPFAMSEGPHTLAATATDPAGNTGPTSTRPITVDSTPPATPVVSAPAPSQVVSDTTPTFSGTAEPGSTVAVKEGGVTLCTAVVGAGGTWSCTPTTALSDGPHTVLVAATDPAGNTGPAAAQNFSVDSTAPAKPIVTTPVTQTNDSTPIIGGTAEPNSSVTVSEGGVPLCTTTANALGNWSCTPTTALSDGPHTVTAVATDPAGNPSPVSTPKSFTVDTLAPAAPVVTAPAEGSTTTNATPTIAGTAEPNSTVTVKEGSTVLCVTTANASGAWSCTSAALVNGAHTLSTTATDSAGNTSPPDIQNFSVNAAITATINTPTAGQVVSSTTPIITGIGAPNGSVVVKEGATTLCTTTADAAGNWSCPSSALSQGAHTITATVTDSGGGSLVSPPRSFSVDTVAPIAPVITAPTAGSTTSNTLPTISGTAEPSSTVKVTDGGAPVCTAIADSSGNWTCAPTTPLSNGPQVLAVTATDPAGNTGPAATRTFTVDTVAPVAPTVSAPIAGSPLTNTTPTISGSSEPSSTVTVRDGPGGPVLCTAVVQANGTWSCTPSTPLSQGPHTLSTTATDPTGNTSPATSTPVTIDSVAPVSPAIIAPSAGSTVSDTTPTISGTGEPSSTIKITDGPTGPVVCTAVVDSSGNWSCTGPFALSDGPHTLNATATDPAGNTSAPTTRPITIDGTAPVAPVVSAPAPGTTVSNTTPTISGSSEPSSTVTVKDGATTLCVTTASASGAWSCTPGTPLSNGSHSVTATATDPAGNTGPASTPDVFTVDNAPPAAPVINSPAAGSTTSNNTPNFNGTAEPNSTVTVSEGGVVLCTAQTDASGNWNCTPSAAMSNGSHTVTATAKDAAGNVGSPTPRTFSISNAAAAINAPTTGSVVSDTTPTFTGTGIPGGQVTVTTQPTGTTVCTTTVDTNGNWTCTPTTALTDGPKTVVATVSNPGGSTTTPPISFGVDSAAPVAPTVTAPAAGAPTNDNTPTVSGTAEPGSTVKVTEGGVPVCTAVADSSGNWSCTPTLAMADGPHTLSVTATDPAGNTSSPTTKTFTVDTLAPSAPSVISPTANAPISSTTPTFSGTGVPSDTIKVTDGPGGPVICTAVVQANGTWSCTPATPLSEGPHTASVTATDPAGNTSPATSKPFTVDSTAPSAPGITQPAAGALIANTTQPVIVGTSEPGASVVVKESATTLCTAVADSGGNWSCTPSSPLSQGAHAITATQTDPAGNVGPASAPRNFTIDTIAPTAPVISAPAAGSTTSSSTPVINGTSEPNSTVTVSEGGVTICTAQADASGNWSCTPSSALSNGSHTIVAAAKDAAGNTSASAARTFSISNAAPSLTGPTAGSVVNTTTPPFSGTGTPGAAVTVTTQPTGTVLCTTTVDASGNWTCTPSTPLSQGPKTVVATISNPGGTTTTPPVTFGVDSVAPTTPVVTAPTAGQSTNDNTPTVSGTAEPGSTVKVTEGGNPVCTAVADSSGNWSCTPTLPMADGAHTISVTATDPAGNVSSPTTRTFGVDTVAPTAPSVVSPTASSPVSTTTPTFGGTGVPSDTVTVRDGPSGPVLCTAVVQANGSWSCTPATPLSDGPHTISVTETDPAGNTSPPTNKPVTVDTAAPAAPSISQPTANALIANTTQPVIVGSAEPLATVVVKEGATTVCTATADAGGNWTCTPSSPLSQGAHAITATQTDTAGNVGPASAPRNFSIDTVAPAAPVVSGPPAGGTTSDNTPTISGTAEPSSTVKVTNGPGGPVLCTATANASGVWSCDVTTPLPNGPQNVSVTATDPAGNTSPPTTRPFSVSNTAPTLQSPTPGQPISDTTPTFGGTGTPGGAVTVTLQPSGTVVCTAVIDANGNWSCTPTTPMPDGPKSVVATITDPGGTTTTPPVSFTVDSVAPNAPVVTAPVLNSTTNDNTPTISGTAEPSSTVKVTDNGVPVCTAIADASGNWTCTPTTPQVDGPHTLSVTATDPAGNVSSPTTRPYKIDTVAPGTPVVSSPAPGSTTGDNTPTLTGTAEPNALVTVKEGNTVLCTAIADANGNWSCTLNPAVADGTHTLSVNQTDPAGNAGPATTVTVKVDTLAPAAPVITAPTSNSTTTDTTPLFTGTAEPNSTVKVIENAAVVCTAIANGAGAWSCEPVTAMAFGTHNVSATSTDAAGNVSPASATVPFGIGNASPGGLDTDGDGILDVNEPGDSDGDGIPNSQEPNNKDTDGDGIPNNLDPDDDGDGILTKNEDLNHDNNWFNDDKDGDGIPAFLDPNDAATPTPPGGTGGDSDGDGIPDATECPASGMNPAGCPDSDGDGVPDYLDPDSDNDGTPDSVEGNKDTDLDGLPDRVESNTKDTDGDGQPNFNDADDDGDGIPTRNEDLNLNGNWLDDDKDGDRIPAYLDPNDHVTSPGGNGGDSDGDSIPDSLECTTVVCPDSDGDGKPDYLDTDSDNDGILDSVEGNKDSDGDGLPDRVEPNNKDTDGDGKPNNLDSDDDGDGIPTKNEDLNGDGNWLNDDKDHDGIPAYLDPNDNATPVPPNGTGGDGDGDGIPDSVECPGGTPCPDTDGDGKPDYLDSDSDNDGIADAVEGTTDTDGDGLPDRLEPNNRDTDGDGKPNSNDADDDGDGIPTANEDLNKDGNWQNDDKDGDGIPAYLDPNDAASPTPPGGTGGDSDGDGIPDSVECPHGAPCPDTDGDGIPDYKDTDSDNDGVPDKTEASSDTDGDGIPDRLESNTKDTDGDGKPNQQDSDDDGDGIPTRNEDLNGDGDWANDDKDKDGIPAYLDPNDHVVPTAINGGDSDDDGIDDKIECPGGVLGGACPDTDGDGVPDYLDPDSDNDGVPDATEGTKDSDGDGVPDRLESNKADTDGDGKPNNIDADDDGDGIPTRNEDTNGDGNWGNDDADKDGIPDYLDAVNGTPGSGGDGDGDGIDDKTECPGGTLGSACPDSDGDGKPDYLDLDSDNDGIPDRTEGTSDTDGDGIPNRLEPNNRDTDKDGKPDSNDADDDGDGIPTKNEDLNHDGNWLNDDADKDGIPAYLDPNDAQKLPGGGDSDGDGLSDATECPRGLPCPDSDGDGVPDNLDTDSDNDGIPDSVEGTTDTDKDGIPNRLESNVLDTDKDGKPNSNDSDDDGDGIPTISEDLNGNGDWMDDDADDDGIPAYLDPNDKLKLPDGGDSDDDGIPDKVECSIIAISSTVTGNTINCTFIIYNDPRGNGQPPYLDTDSDGDGIPDSVEGIKDTDVDGVPDRLEPNNRDTDGDGIVNYLDPDDDGDSIPTKNENLNENGTWFDDDADKDGIPAFLDPNDAQGSNPGPGAPNDADGDGLLDNVECPRGVSCPDTDGDGKPDYMDPDSDGDGVPDGTEGVKDTDVDGVPDRLESNRADTDGDGKPNYNDPDDDGDGIPTANEDLNGDKNWANDDADGDGVPAYLDPNDSNKLPNGGDTDGDGIPDGAECSTAPACRDTDGDGRPDYNDTDSDGDDTPDATEGVKDTDLDGIPDRIESNKIDTDGDGKPNQNDPDDDGDGIPTKCPTPAVGQECNADLDGDGIPAYLDPNDHLKLPNGGDSDGDGIPDKSECPNGLPCPDPNGNGRPGYTDPNDSVKPTVDPNQSGLPGGQGGLPTINGTGIPGTTVTVTESGQPVCTAVVDATGRWTCTASLPPGSHTVVATSSDGTASAPTTIVVTGRRVGTIFLPIIGKNYNAICPDSVILCVSNQTNK